MRFTGSSHAENVLDFPLGLFIIYLFKTSPDHRQLGKHLNTRTYLRYEVRPPMSGIHMPLREVPIQRYWAKTPGIPRLLGRMRTRFCPSGGIGECQQGFEEFALFD
ncbi:hypothetical protein K402DRAFT_395690 [Aulographum hederae CBS 113979]|uniref:Uncharacterized protein n=1 Tax=Aulographum hederae CBS 113979 TaxID=1176131 RepID=A0A6G1GU96_9PEZI|nr:hypothetical protein K402DRAFT_395690 [Aulographum hederae CBS 113979]